MKTIITTTTPQIDVGNMLYIPNYYQYIVCTVQLYIDSGLLLRL